MPKHLKIDSLIEGMELAEPVLNKLGQVIIGKNSVLTTKQIMTLQLWGIKEVFIKGDENEENTELNLAILDEEITKIKAVLAWDSNNIFINELIELAAISSIKNLKRL